MRSTLRHTILFILLGRLFCPWAGAQDFRLPDPVESVRLFTDRSLYIAGEAICFSASLSLKNKPSPDNPSLGKPSPDGGFSKVLYLEIIDRSGKQVLGRKFPVRDIVCTGIIGIPEELSTGIYYIRSYTKSMRNAGPESFACNQIRIINLSGENMPEEGEKNTRQQSGYLLESPDTHRRVFDMRTDRKVYGQSDSVRLVLQQMILPDSLVSACLSVVPDGSCNTEILSLQKAGKAVDHFHFEPEYHGLTISGVVRDKRSGRELPSRNLDLTILGANSDFMSVYTDSSGKFSFPLPGITGQHNLFIGIPESDSTMPLILIDNDFCTQPVGLPYTAFHLRGEERNTALKLARNYQVARGFGPDIPESASGSQKSWSEPFYGKPTVSLNLDEFIQLPTLEDYFNELPYFVKVRKMNGRKYLKILGNSPELSIFHPLVLLDMVAVYDMDKLLSISFTDISHIDIINEPYIKGIMTYGGLVSIVSKNKDFAGMDLPRAGIFINYDFFSPVKAFNCEVRYPDAPDARNTLFWEGDLRVGEDRLESMSFKTGNSNGEYAIVVRGVLLNGKTFIQKLNFRVE